MSDPHLETALPLRVREIVGAGADAALLNAGLPVPEAPQTALPHGEGLVACTGRNDYLVISADDWPCPSGPPPWCLERSDMVMRLTGAAWPEVMTQLCPHDLRQLPAGGWFMAAVAGVTAWLYRPEAAPGTLLLGCDPSYGAYLQSMLDAVVTDHRDAPSID